jgi:putative membrane protein
MTSQHRAPQAFDLANDEHPHGKPAKAKARRGPDIVFAPEPQNTEIVALPQTAAPPLRRGRPWLGLLLSALLALISLWASLSIVQLVESLFARSAWLGWIGFGAACIAGFAALAIILREVFGLWRLSRMEHVQETAGRALNLDDAAAADATISSLKAMYGTRPDQQWALQRFNVHANAVMDPRDRVKLAESFLLHPLDAQVQKIIARRARRVTLLTTVTPAAILDILFVAAQNFAMLREVATLYGGRPSTMATLKLARQVATHLAVTGGLALSDNLIQHFVGKGLLGKLSARFGEGAVNGILTARIGLAAAAVCRPIPKPPGGTETLTKLLKEVMSFADKDKQEEPAA